MTDTPQSPVVITDVRHTEHARPQFPRKHCKSNSNTNTPVWLQSACTLALLLLLIYTPASLPKHEMSQTADSTGSGLDTGQLASFVCFKNMLVAVLARLASTPSQAHSTMILMM